jgi:hypothetical protein
MVSGRLPGTRAGEKTFFSSQTASFGCPKMPKNQVILPITCQSADRNESALNRQPKFALINTLRTPPPYSVPSVETVRSLVGRVAPCGSAVPEPLFWVVRAGTCLTVRSSALQLLPCSCQANAPRVSLFLCRLRVPSSSKIQFSSRKVDLSASLRKLFGI